MKTIETLTAELKSTLTDMDVYVPNDSLLTLEVKSAIGVINRCRRFTPKDEILYDEYYEDKIVPLAVAGFLKTGAEGEIMHTENGVSRSYTSDGKYPNAMLKDIAPLAKFQ